MGIGLGLAAGPLNLGLVLIRVGKTESNWGWIPDWWIASTNSQHAWGLLALPENGWIAVEITALVSLVPSRVGVQ